MCRCASCNNPLESHEMIREIELEDGSTKLIVDDWCNSCLGKYVTRVDELDSHSYSFEYETEVFAGNYHSYSE